MDKIDLNKLARVVTKAGIILMESGAETYRVEDTMERICKAYGATIVDSYATPTMLLISFSINDELCHNIKRVKLKSVDLTKIDQVNALSRYVSNHQIELDKCNDLLDEINNTKPYSDLIMILGAIICSFGFTFFFKGSFMDAIIASIIGLIIKMLNIFLNKIEFSAFFNNVICGSLVTLLAMIIAHFGLCNQDIIIISVIMLLVPGLAITNAIRDTVGGDLVSGLTRTTEAIFIAIALALGSGIILMLFGGIL